MAKIKEIIVNSDKRIILSYDDSDPVSDYYHMIHNISQKKAKEYIDRDGLTEDCVIKTFSFPDESEMKTLEKLSKRWGVKIK